MSESLAGKIRGITLPTTQPTVAEDAARCGGSMRRLDAAPESGAETSILIDAVIDSSAGTSTGSGIRLRAGALQPSHKNPLANTAGAVNRKKRKQKRGKTKETKPKVVLKLYEKQTGTEDGDKWNEHNDNINLRELRQ